MSVFDIDPPIDLEKSIAKQRLFYVRTTGIASGFYIIFSAIIFSTLIILLRSQIEVFLYILPLDLFFIVFGISGLFLRDMLVQVNQKGPVINNDEIAKTLNEFYPEFKFQYDSEKILWGKELGPLIRGRIITVILSENKILLNITRLERGNEPSFIFGLTCYLKAKKIAKYFGEKYPS